MVSDSCWLPPLVAVHAFRRAAAQAPAPPAQRQALLPGRGEQDTPDVLPDAVLANMLDTYAIVQAQRELTITDEQYGTFAARLKKLQDVRRRNQRQRQQILRELVRHGRPARARTRRRDHHPRAQLTALREHDERAAVELRQAYDALDEILDTRQQARFRSSRNRSSGASSISWCALVERAPAEAARSSSPAAARRRSAASVCVQLLYGFSTAVTVAAFGLSLTIAHGARHPAIPRSQLGAQTRLDQAGRRSLPGQARTHLELCQRRPRRRRRPQRAAVADDAAHRRRAQRVSSSSTSRTQVPAGVVEPTLKALGEGRVRGAAAIDLDAVRKQKQRWWTDPLGYMTGKLPLTASGLLITQNGVGRFQLESAELSGIAIPKSLLQELLAFYSKSPKNLPASAWTTPSSCPPASRKSAWARGKRWWCNRSPFSRRCSTSRASARGAPPTSSASACTRSKTFSTGFPSATKTAARSRRLPRSGLASRRRSLGEVVGGGIRPTRRPRFKIFELVVRDRPARCAPSGSISRFSTTSSGRTSASSSSASWS